MSERAPLIFLVAGEPSGDALGGRLMAALLRATGGRVRFAGIGGEAMRRQGLESLFPMEELSVMGIVEILPHARRLFARMRQTAAAIDAAAPDAVVTIDAPAFAHGVVKRIRNRTIPRIHYVAPQLWAWRPWRVHKFRRHFDHVLALLPFEPEWFARRGVSCRFVGHPVVEAGADAGERAAVGAAYRARHGIDADAPVICVLPGSRRGEVSRLAMPFRETLALLAAAHPGLVAVVPTVANVGDLAAAAAADWPLPTFVTRDPAENAAAMQASNVALAASGTVTLEVARAGVPFVVAYRVAPLTALLGRILVRIPYANLINLILDREVAPEFLQGDCRPDRLAAAVSPLFGPAGAAQVAAARDALARMGAGATPPSQRAAEAVLDIIAAATETEGNR